MSREWSYSRGSAGMPGPRAYQSAALVPEHRVSRWTVRQALAAAELPVRRVHGAGLQCRSHAPPGRTEGREQAWRPTPANALRR